MRYVGAPAVSTLPENCTMTASRACGNRILRVEQRVRFVVDVAAVEALARCCRRVAADHRVDDRALTARRLESCCNLGSKRTDSMGFAQREEICSRVAPMSARSLSGFLWSEQSLPLR